MTQLLPLVYEQGLWCTPLYGVPDGRCVLAGDEAADADIERPEGGRTDGVSIIRSLLRLKRFRPRLLRQ